MDVEKKREYKSKVSTILEEVKNKDINLGNYRKYQDKLQATEEIILAQIENTMTDYEDLSSKYSDYTSKTSFKDGLEGGIVSKEVFEVLLEIIRNSKERFSWQSLQLELNSVMRNRLAEIMGDTQAYEIKKDSLKEMREDSKRIIEMSLNMQKQNNDLVQANINGRIQYLEDKMTTFMERSISKINDERRQMYDLLRTVVKVVKESYPKEEIIEELLEPQKITKKEILDEISPELEDTKRKAQEMLEKQKLENEKLRKQLEEQKKKMDEESSEEVSRTPKKASVNLDDIDEDEMDDLDDDNESAELEELNKEDW